MFFIAGPSAQRRIAIDSTNRKVEPVEKVVLPNPNLGTASHTRDPHRRHRQSSDFLIVYQESLQRAKANEKNLRSGK